MTTPENSLGFLMSDVSRLMRRAFEQHLSEGDLTLGQGRALIYVSRNEGCRQVELAELLEIKPITLARLIDSLEKAGLVERRADPGDRRAYRLYLREPAHQVLEKIETLAQRIRAKAQSGLGEEEIAAMLSTLRKMRHNLTSR